ncbi:class I adenylate-forming enzyme family protein [Amycolatopsis sp. CA-230715]|uniref:class I adenylate-forming enzyme family protein n=1 Tax=Amycolatopsis sp. CA-230715 TaxID=2745196 RepID=UPI001C00FA99|nr:class I adenylate-forming enzyme family protein [Amycolatopsis sp. CA-230715]QWF78563.1 Long-chain-fatty-acid--CoA ligase [Amycolatopsis sp. CA-230715]
MSPKLFATDSVQTFPDFERHVLNLADALRQRGISLGSRVLLKAGNSAGYLGTLFALMHLGASTVLVDHQEHADETRRIARQAGVKAIVVDDDAPIGDDEAPIFIYDLHVAAAGRTPSERKLSFEAWSELDDALIMWSSGSTGKPKGIVKNGGRFLRNLRRNADHMGHHGGDVLLPLLPFSHQYGISMVLIAWLAQCSLVIAPYRRIDRAIRMGIQCGVTVLDATPATYRSLHNIVGKRPALRDELGGVRMFCAGAAPLDPALSDRYVETFGLPLLDSYGSTELGNISFATVDNPAGCGNAMAGLAVKIVDDDGNQMPSGELGEILVDTPDMMEGYLGDDGALVPVDRGWYRTNDFGHLDERGNLFVAGRKLAVHRMGYTLYPEVIERKVAAAGCSARIVALPDERRGSQLVFFVEDEERREARHWRELIADVLPAYEQPNRVEVLESFPLNRNGKPDKKRLEKLAVE